LDGCSFGLLVGQQVVNRGKQPWFYYVFIQIPMYEYLPALGTLLAALVGFRRKLWSALHDQPFAPIEIDTDSNEDISIELGEDYGNSATFSTFSSHSCTFFILVGEQFVGHSRLPARKCPG
jgi:hypothetical protein